MHSRQARRRDLAAALGRQGNRALFRFPWGPDGCFREAKGTQEKLLNEIFATLVNGKELVTDGACKSNYNYN